MPPLPPKRGQAAPSIRLATGVGPPDAFAKGFTDPTVRLALGGTHTGDVKKAMRADQLQEQLNDVTRPALLVSFFYLKQFLENKERYHYRNWVMDSGAFSAHNSGAEINLQEYIDCCKQLMATDQTLVEIYSLDVIGDWKGSLKNTEEMWKQGVPAIPCYHFNEPWDALKGMARDYPKIALGGVALNRSKAKMEWAKQCFARVWPKPIHGFAFGGESAVMTLPFHSVDASNWELGPCKFGQWKAFGGQRVSVRGSQQNLRAEVEWYLALEEKARVRWRNEMKKLQELLKPDDLIRRSTTDPSVRLACVGAQGEINGALAKHDLRPNPPLTGPTIRLAEGGSAARVPTKEAAFKPKS